MTTTQLNNTNNNTKQLFLCEPYFSNNFQIESIYLYNKSGLVLHLTNLQNLNLKQYNYYNEEYFNTTSLRGLYLNKYPIKKLKETFTTKDNYYLKSKNTSSTGFYDLYINVDIENIEIIQHDQTTTESYYNYKEYNYYNNYTVKGLNVLYHHLNRTFKASNDKLDHTEREVKEINKEIEFYKERLKEFENHKNKSNIERNLNTLLEQQKNGKDYIVYYYAKDVSNEIKYQRFSHTETSKDTLKVKENIKELKEIVKSYSEKDIYNKMLKLGLDLAKVDIKELLK